ncbi:hypothetical protein L0244_24425 [bacterium]|nr:hypothetical protein [bacterium]MCI0616141.1 hypothetical protein [bacterium]
MVTQKTFGEDFTSDFSFPKFSPDGQRIAYRRQGGKDKYALWVSAVAGGPPVLVTLGIGLPSWSPDGEWIAHHTHSQEGLWWLAKTRSGGRF